MDSRLLGAVSAVLLLMVGLAGCSVGTPAADNGLVTDVTVHDDDGLNGAVLPDPYVVSNRRLTATDGSVETLDSVTDDAGDALTMVFFGYTHCPDICQVVMADIASALTRLDDEERARIGMRFVTTDPARDDEVTLRAYLDRFDPEFEGLTGPLSRIVEVGSTVGVAIEKGRRLPSGGYEVGHGTQIVGILPDGTAPVVWTEGTGPAQIAEDLHEILAGGVPEVSGS